jgi:hypothetical protein
MTHLPPLVYKRPFGDALVLHSTLYLIIQDSFPQKPQRPPELRSPLHPGPPMPCSKQSRCYTKFINLLTKTNPVLTRKFSSCSRRSLAFSCRCCCSRSRSRSRSLSHLHSHSCSYSRSRNHATTQDKPSLVLLPGPSSIPWSGQTSGAGQLSTQRHHKSNTPDRDVLPLTEVSCFLLAIRVVFLRCP